MPAKKNTKNKNKILATADTTAVLKKLFSEAKDPVKFAKMFLNWEPHPAQQEIMRTKARVYTIAAGRRFGKSEMMAVLALYYIFYGKGDVIIFAPSYRQTKIIFKNAVRFLNQAKYLNTLVESIRRSPYPEIEFMNGRTLMAMSTHEYDMIRGYSAYVAILDEAAYIPDEAVSEVIEPMLLDKYGLLYKISTPVPGLKNHFYETFKLGALEEERKGKMRKYVSFRYPTFANPHIDKRALEDLKQKLGEDSLAWRVEILAEFTTESGLLFPFSLIKGLQRDYKIESPQAGRRYIAGVDFAKANDYTAVIVLDATEIPAKVVHAVRWHTNNWLSNVDRVETIARQFPGVKIVCDATGVGAPLYELLKQRRLNVDGYSMTALGKQDLISTLKITMEEGRIALPTEDKMPAIHDVVEELMYFQYSISSDGKIKLVSKKGYHDDFVIALALACVGLRGVAKTGVTRAITISREEYENMTWNIRF